MERAAMQLGERAGTMAQKENTASEIYPRARKKRTGDRMWRQGGDYHQSRRSPPTLPKCGAAAAPQTRDCEAGRGGLARAIFDQSAAERAQPKIFHAFCHKTSYRHRQRLPRRRGGESSAEEGIKIASLADDERSPPLKRVDIS